MGGFGLISKQQFDGGFVLSSISTRVKGFFCGFFLFSIHFNHFFVKVEMYPSKMYGKVILIRLFIESTALQLSFNGWVRASNFEVYSLNF